MVGIRIYAQYNNKKLVGNLAVNVFTNMLIVWNVRENICPDNLLQGQNKLKVLKEKCEKSYSYDTTLVENL